MRLALVPLVLIALTGCTTKYDLSGAEWTKPGALVQTVTLDEMECARTAREAGYTPDLIVGGLVDLARVAIEERQRGSAYRQCMTGRGYQPVGS